jgi:hypothetical protein
MDERRKGQPRDHDLVVRSLTEQQALTINNYEGFGWSSFVRWPLFKPHQAVLVSPDKRTVVLVNEEGELVTEHEVNLRD